MLLEWTYSTLRTYHQQLATVSVNVVPEIWLNAILVSVENMSVTLTLQYNTLYNVSITQPGICEQPNLMAYVELNYCKYYDIVVKLMYYKFVYNTIVIYHTAKCSNPVKLVHYDVMVEGYNDPALEGENITLICSPESMLTGPSSSRGMENGNHILNMRHVQVAW